MQEPQAADPACSPRCWLTRRTGRRMPREETSCWPMARPSPCPAALPCPQPASGPASLTSHRSALWSLETLSVASLASSGEEAAGIHPDEACCAAPDVLMLCERADLSHRPCRTQMPLAYGAGSPERLLSVQGAVVDGPVPAPDLAPSVPAQHAAMAPAPAAPATNPISFLVDVRPFSSFQHTLRSIMLEALRSIIERCRALHQNPAPGAGEALCHSHGESQPHLYPSCCCRP